MQIYRIWIWKWIRCTNQRPRQLIPPSSSGTNTNSWKPVLTKNQKKKLKKQEKRAKKAKFLQEAASLNSSTASPDSTLDS
ncbi:hypothetical protein RclHR1_25720001 [Rhizophagus clarus]|uniref:Uncharacterized protein n=1 Tax=Rhizophagus clarus TaxID=94130 RepID=A0A2Z6RUF2_9GLOM|nr:hypothetical protein RclHR1_25720001 [Rhizophagus clarus]GES82702.1 hypothetical protein RCL_e11134_RclHR1_25720001 [Rhizophagus clarus]